jgi:RNA polymerase sigma factor (sigma-70 family)
MQDKKEKNNMTYLEEYCDNEMKKLKQLCYPILIKIGGLSEKDYDDFYSIALDALTDSVIRFNDSKNCQFKTFLIGNIKRKFITEIRDRNRYKRIPAKNIQSFDGYMSEDGIPLSEIIPSGFDIFEEVCAHNGWKENKIEKYLSKLSIIQRKIVSLLSEGYKAKEIRELLHMSEKEYSQNLAAIQAYENVRELM